MAEIDHAGMGAAYLRSHPDVPIAHDLGAPCGYCLPARTPAEGGLPAELRALSDAATPGPWIRKWQSLDVHHMGGDDALRSQQDIDFAVAAVNYIRVRLASPSERSETHE